MGEGTADRLAADPLEEAFANYMLDPEEDNILAESALPRFKRIRDPVEEIMLAESTLPCPTCASEIVDRSAGYRGEYKCRSCGHFWRR